MADRRLRVPFGFEQYEQMAEIMKTCRGKVMVMVMVSINDHPDIRRCLMAFTRWGWTLNMPMPAHGAAQTSKELVIMNWEPSAFPRAEPRPSKSAHLLLRNNAMFRLENIPFSLWDGHKFHRSEMHSYIQLNSALFAGSDC